MSLFKAMVLQVETVEYPAVVMEKDSIVLVDISSQFVRDFEPLEKLGSGGYGIVFRVKHKKNDTEYAVKRIVLPNNNLEDRDENT